MKIKDAKGKLKIGMRVRTDGNSYKTTSKYFIGVIGEISKEGFYIWQNEMEGIIGSKVPRGYKFSWYIDWDNKEATITILDKKGGNMDTPKKAKWGVSYYLDGDPVEFFKTKKQAQDRVDELMKDNAENVFMFEIGKVYEVKAPVSYELVEVK